MANNPALQPLGPQIAHTIHVAKSSDGVVYVALYLLLRLQSQHPGPYGGSGYALFLTALMLATKTTTDENYATQTWKVAAKRLYSLKEINESERQMCDDLHWDVNVTPEELQEFEVRVKRDFSGPGPYPSYNLPLVPPSDVLMVKICVSPALFIP